MYYLARCHDKYMSIQAPARYLWQPRFVEHRQFSDQISRCATIRLKTFQVDTCTYTPIVMNSCVLDFLDSTDLHLPGLTVTSGTKHSQVTVKNRWRARRNGSFSMADVEVSGSELRLQDEVNSPMDRRYSPPCGVAA